MNHDTSPAGFVSCCVKCWQSPLIHHCSSFKRAKEIKWNKDCRQSRSQSWTKHPIYLVLTLLCAHRVLRPQPQAMAAYGPPVGSPIRFQLATPQITNCPCAWHGLIQKLYQKYSQKLKKEKNSHPHNMQLKVLYENMFTFWICTSRQAAGHRFSMGWWGQGEVINLAAEDWSINFWHTNSFNFMSMNKYETSAKIRKTMENT